MWVHEVEYPSKPADSCSLRRERTAPGISPGVSRRTRFNLEPFGIKRWILLLLNSLFYLTPFGEQQNFMSEEGRATWRNRTARGSDNEFCQSTNTDNYSGCCWGQSGLCECSNRNDLRLTFTGGKVHLSVWYRRSCEHSLLADA